MLCVEFCYILGATQKHTMEDDNMKELFPEAYGLQQKELAAAAILKQYVMDNGISELAQAFDGNTVDAAKLVHLIEKAKPYAIAAIRQSSLNTEVETRIEQMIESVKGSMVMGDINPRFLAFLEDLLKSNLN